jgi:hypothetical protein
MIPFVVTLSNHERNLFMQSSLVVLCHENLNLLNLNGFSDMQRTEICNKMNNLGFPITQYN